MKLFCRCWNTWKYDEAMSGEYGWLWRISKLNFQFGDVQPRIIMMTPLVFLVLLYSISVLAFTFVLVHCIIEESTSLRIRVDSILLLIFSIILKSCIYLQYFIIGVHIRASLHVPSSQKLSEHLKHIACEA